MHINNYNINQFNRMKGQMMKKQMTVFAALFLIVSMFSAVNGFGKAITPEEIKQNLPKLLGANNAGNDFWITFHPCWETYNPKNALKIYVSSGARTLVTCEVPGMGFIESKMTKPNDVIEFSIEPGVGQCYQKTDRDRPQPDKVFRARAVHLYAKQPFICYGVTRYQYTSDSFLALPTSSLGKEYIVAAYADPTDNTIQWLPAYTSIVAAYDNTKVKFTMGGNIYSKTAGGLKPGQSNNEVLNAGDVYLISGIGALADISGSKVIASKPVAVISGNMCAYIPSEYGYCDFIIEQELPTSTWGTKYHVSRIQTRKKNSLLKVFVKEPMTTLFRNGRQMGQIQYAGGTDGVGYWSIRYDEEVNQTWVWEGDKPISVTQYNPGQSYDNIVSDPFQLVLTPIEQYQTEIVFCTPGVYGGYGYPDNYINVVYLGNEDGSLPDDLEFAKVVDGKFSWRKLSAIDPTAGFLFKDDKLKGRQYYCKPMLLPGDGVYRIRAKDPFTAYAYGFSDYDSYGHPTSVALADLDRPDTVPPDPKWSMECGDVEGATVKEMPDDDEVRSNLALILFDEDNSFNYLFEYEPFVAGETRTTTWKATVIDKSKDARGIISFIDRRGNDTTIVIEYFATKLAIEPPYFDFGKLQVGQQVDQVFKVRNLAGGDVVLTRLKLKQGNQNFELLNYTLPVTIPKDGTMDFTVRFTATREGEFRDSIGAGDDCLFMNLALVEARVGTPEIEVSDANFGDITLGESSTKAIEIQNHGSTDLVITGFTGPFHPDKVYTYSGLKNMSPADPLIIPPTKTYTYNVTFTPKAEISYPDSMVFSSNADKIDSVAILFGTGIKADLVANNYDWERKRIDRPAFPIAPYVPDYPVIKLKNNGSKEVLIPNIAINDVYGDGDAFKFDKTKFVNMRIPPKDSVTVPVTFQPKRVGKYEIIISYPGNTAQSPTTTKLEGIGILGRIETFSMDFDTTIVKDYTNIQKRTIRISNTPWSDKDGTDVSDSVTITNLVIQPNGTTISTDGTNWGDEGFRFDITKLHHSGTGQDVTLPVVLKKGEYIEFEPEFVATHIANHAGSFSTVSDAEQDVKSDWTGFGVAQGVYATGGNAKICVYEEALINCSVGNNGSGTIQVTSVKMVPQLADFEFVDPTVANGFPLTSGEVKQIQIRYKPTTVGTPATQLVIENSTLEDPVVTAQIRGEAVHFSRKTNNTTTTNKVISGQNFYYSINFEDGQDISMANTKEFYVKIQYRKDFVAAMKDEVHIGDFIKNSFDMAVQFNEIDPVNKIEEIALTFTSKSGQILTGSGELVKIGFQSFLPWYRTDEGQNSTRLDSVIISYDIAAVGTKCLDISNSSTKVMLEPTCVNNLRQIKISDNRYALYQISPNPVDARGAEIEFSVALKGWTEITIINSAGEVVDVPMSGEMDPGQYAARIPVDKLSSGSYIITMKSGPYISEQKLIIRK